MPNPHPIALRTRAVAAYEAGEGSYVAIAEQFTISVSSLLRWVDRTRTTGDLTPTPKGGGWRSTITAAVLTAVITDRPDATVEEIRRAYNRRVRRSARVSRSSIVRAMQRSGYVLKKRCRPSEVDRPDVHLKRAAFRRWMRRVDPTRLVVLDEAGANLAMGRTHAWMPRGQEYVEPRPMNWGNNLTLVGAVRPTGWVTLNTQWQAMTAAGFVTWVRRRLAPRLRPGDIVLLDNLRAHHAAAVRPVVAARGARLRFLPPYSPDFSPIEPAWSLVKRDIRAHAPRTAAALRRVAQRARHVVRPAHCRQWFAHAGYRQLK